MLKPAEKDLLASSNLIMGLKLPRKGPLLWHTRSHTDKHTAVHISNCRFIMWMSALTEESDGKQSDEDESLHDDRWTFCMDAECPCICVILYASARTSVLA